MAKDNYCDIQENCKLLKSANTQYNKVVEQSRSLQGELNNAKEELENLVTFFTEDEISMINRLLRYNRAINAIKEISERGFNYSQCNCGAKANLEDILKEIERIGE